MRARGEGREWGGQARAGESGADRGWMIRGGRGGGVHRWRGRRKEEGGGGGGGFRGSTELNWAGLDEAGVGVGDRRHRSVVSRGGRQPPRSPLWEGGGGTRRSSEPTLLPLGTAGRFGPPSPPLPSPRQGSFLSRRYERCEGASESSSQLRGVGQSPPSPSPKGRNEEGGRQGGEGGRTALAADDGDARAEVEELADDRPTDARPAWSARRAKRRAIGGGGGQLGPVGRAEGGRRAGGREGTDRRCRRRPFL